MNTATNLPVGSKFKTDLFTWTVTGPPTADGRIPAEPHGPHVGVIGVPPGDIREVIYVAPAAPTTPDRAEYNRDLIELAIKHGLAVFFDYQKPSEDYAAGRYVEPTSVVEGRNGVAVVGKDLDNDKAVRMFRLDRIQETVEIESPV